MKVAVIGSRTFKDKERLFAVLSSNNITHIISGGAIGADTIAEQWAAANNIPVTIYKPDWEKFGKSAGFIRNYDIIKDAEMIIAFWDGESKGTEHSLKYANKIGKKIVVENF